MNPEIWGPPAWTFLHSITLAYPDNPTDSDKINYENFFNILQPILPCAKCSNNYKIHLQEDPITNHLDSKSSLVKWLINLHNKVNKINGKRELNYNEVINHYKLLYNGDLNSVPIKETNTTNIYLTIIFILLIIGLIYVYIKKYLK
jgi:type IV secretory pathway VirB4 component